MRRSEARLATYEDHFWLCDGCEIGLRAEYVPQPGYRATRRDPGHPGSVDLHRVWFWQSARFPTKDNKGEWAEVGAEGWAILSEMGLTKMLREKILEEWDRSPDPDRMRDEALDRREA